MASLLFAPLAWDLPEDKTAAESSTGASTAEPSTTSDWPKSEPSAPSSGRWRINSGDLEEMMRVASGLDSTSRPASAPLLEDNGGSSSPPLSREDLVEERVESVVGFPLSRGSSPLYRKQHQLHQQQQQHHVAGCSDSGGYGNNHTDHHLDTTAPSSPCTPSLHMRGASGTLSAVSPTSSRSDEVAFQQQLSLEADSRAAAAPTLSARPSGGVAAHGGSSSINNNTGSPSGGRFGLKLLVSNSMAGTLIGKGGTRICEIKDEVRRQPPTAADADHIGITRPRSHFFFYMFIFKTKKSNVIFVLVFVYRYPHWREAGFLLHSNWHTIQKRFAVIRYLSFSSFSS